jgi:hypothetical protein
MATKERLQVITSDGCCTGGCKRNTEQLVVSLGGGLAHVQRELGGKTGENLWQMAHGRDLRVVQTPKPRKSLGAEVNWGIRFRNQQDADQFLLRLSGEVRSALPHLTFRAASMSDSRQHVQSSC